MPMRKSSLAPALLAIFLVPVTIPVLFALLATPWPEGARAQDQNVGIKRAELPPSRPASAPIRAAAIPRKSVVNRPSEKTNEILQAGQAPKLSSKVAVQQSGPKSDRTTAPALQSRAAGAITKAPIPPKAPRVQQAARETAPQSAAPTPNDFVGTEQRSQEVNRKLDADLAQTPRPIKRPAPKRQPIIELEDDDRPAEINVSTADEQELPFDPLDQQPKIAVTERATKPTLEMIPEPPAGLAQNESALDDSTQGVTNAYFEEPLMEDPTFEKPFIEDEKPPIPTSKRLLANDLADEMEDDDDELDEEIFVVEANVTNVMNTSNTTADNETQAELDVVANAPPAVEVREANTTPADIPQPILPQDPTKSASPKWFTDLRTINSIDLREAVQIPPLAAGDNTAKILKPVDQADAFLAQRRAVNFSAVYWKPWQADRDSYPFCHYPLYFEDPNLERCGRGWGCATTFVSLGRFYANIPFIPYRVTAEPHHCRVPTLPDCPACQKFGYDAYLPPWSWKAAAVQTGAYFGAIYIVP